jgi:ribbon-helix-helix CopG family protein
MKRNTKHPEEMNATELKRATRQLEKPNVYGTTRSMTSAERAAERKLRRRGRPKVGSGAKKVSISLEADLLKRTDAAARRKGLNRSELISGFVSAALRKAI